ncbi:unnamed protein product, partial [Ceratitis capitata]
PGSAERRLASACIQCPLCVAFLWIAACRALLMLLLPYHNSSVKEGIERSNDDGLKAQRLKESIMEAEIGK